MPRDSSTALRFARNDITVVLLAGGESRRMGRNKATLLVHGKPLWQIQLGLLIKLEPSQILISARTDPAWRPADVEFVADLSPAHGPLSGLAASIAKMRSPHLLVLAIDVPLMTESFLRSLCKRADTGRGVVPKIGDRYEPLVAIYPREAAVEFRNALAGEDFSLQRVVRGLIDTGKLREISVTEQERQFFSNLNERSDLESI